MKRAPTGHVRRGTSMDPAGNGWQRFSLQTRETRRSVLLAGRSGRERAGSTSEHQRRRSVGRPRVIEWRFGRARVQFAAAWREQLVAKQGGRCVDTAYRPLRSAQTRAALVHRSPNLVKQFSAADRRWSVNGHPPSERIERANVGGARRQINATAISRLGHYVKSNSRDRARGCAIERVRCTRKPSLQSFAVPEFLRFRGRVAKIS